MTVGKNSLWRCNRCRRDENVSKPCYCIMESCYEPTQCVQAEGYEEAEVSWERIEERWVQILFQEMEFE